MHPSLLAMVAAVVVVAGGLTGTPAEAGHVMQGYCDGGIPADETVGFRSFPRGDVFCPLMADPKGDVSFGSYLRGTKTSTFGLDIGSMGLSDRLGLFRWNGPAVGEGVQLSLSASVFAQFDLRAKTSDLINADYLVGLPLTIRRGPVSARVRVYHQSSHLGDEFVLRSPIKRENFGFESAESLISIDMGPLRTYAGGEYLFSRRPGGIKPGVAHGGIELRQGGSLLPVGSRRLRAVAALDVKSAEAVDWSFAFSARAGLEVGYRPGVEHRSRPWSLLGEFYDGPSPYGQFFHEDVSYYGVGLHLGL